MKTFEEIALETLEDLQPCSIKIWSKALGYKSPQAFHWTQKKLLENDKISRKKVGRKYLYTINEEAEHE